MPSSTAARSPGTRSKRPTGAMRPRPASPEGSVHSQVVAAERPDRPGPADQQGARAEDRTARERARHRLRRSEEEHPGRRVPAGTEAAEPDAWRHARRVASRAAHAEGDRARDQRASRRDRSGRHRLLQRQPRAVQRSRRGLPHRADRGHARSRCSSSPIGPATMRPRRRKRRRRRRC